MNVCYTRMATWIAMLVIMASGLVTVVSAADCEIPAFLVVGKSYQFALGGMAFPHKVVEVARQTCWIKTEDKDGGIWWVNIKQVSAIQEIQKPPAQTQPGQRR